MRKSFVLSAILLFLLVLPRPTYAFRHQILNEVLGVSTASALPQIEPTAEGPGLILPDSPLFFLDQLKQNIRLTLAFSPEEKAKIRAQIAGERLAELRFMLAKNNQRGARVALQGVSDNLNGAAVELTRAQFAGKDVKKLAKDINNNIKLKQKTLDSLEKNATGSLKLEVGVAQDAIFESKVEVEDALPDEDLENEVKDDLARRIERKVENASSSAKLLRKDLNELTKQASESAVRSLKRRQEALKKAIEQADERERKIQEKLLEQEKIKQTGLLRAQEKAAVQAQDALFRAQRAATEFQKAQQVVNEIRSNTVAPTPAPTTNSGGSSSNSGSGSSSSGSSNSGSGSSSSGSSGSSGSSERGKSGGESESGSGKH